MSYENAPATKMLATHCAVCARPLVDAKSVECGVGPECRKKYGFNVDVSEEARHEANKLVYEIAAVQSGPVVVQNTKKLFELGFTQLVLAILKRVATVQVSVTDDKHPHGAGRLALVTPYAEETVNAMRFITGRRWDKEHKCNTFPMESKAAVWAFIQKWYKGKTLVGPKGPAVIGEQTEVQKTTVAA